MSDGSFQERLLPFYDRRCTLRLDGAVAPGLAASHGEVWTLFVFDWSRATDGQRAEIYERSNQEAFDAFALIAPSGDDDDLDALLAAADPSGGARAGTGGFLLFADDVIYVGDGDVWELTRDLDAFFAALRPA